CHRSLASRSPPCSCSPPPHPAPRRRPASAPARPPSARPRSTCTTPSSPRHRRSRRRSASSRAIPAAPAPSPACPTTRPTSSRPAVSDPTLQDLIGNVDKFNALDAKLERAGRRLRELGVSKRVVEWYTADTLLDGIDPGEALG